VLPPEKHTFDTLWGHAGPRRLVPRLLGAGRLPHALLLAGPDAIGKRSLALAMAKAILSAGLAASPATLTAPRPAGARRTIEPPADEPEGEDIFGDPHDATADLFGDEEPPPPAPASPAPAIPPPAPSFQPATSNFQLPASTFRGFDPRVCRLVEAAYTSDTGAGHPDLWCVEPKGRSRNILVDQVRDMQERAGRSPLEGAYKVVVVLGVDTITSEGANSILKLLEEPPGYLVMILVANGLHRVLPTIKSRCSVVPMTPLGVEELTRLLVEHEGLEPALARVAAALGEGRPGAALSVVRGGALDRRRDVFEARLQLDRFGRSTVPASAARIAKSGDLDQSLWLLLSFLRDRLVRQSAPGADHLLVHADAFEQMNVPKADLILLDEEAERLLDAYAQLRHPYIPNPRLMLQTALWPEE
jgi:DNA polymerase-3 subunit delta'